MRLTNLRMHVFATSSVTQAAVNVSELRLFTVHLQVGNASTESGPAVDQRAPCNLHTTAVVRQFLRRQKCTVSHLLISGVQRPDRSNLDPGWYNLTTVATALPIQVRRLISKHGSLAPILSKDLSALVGMIA